MEIRNAKPTQANEPRRFSAGRATSKNGAGSFADALKKAATEAKSPSDTQGLSEAETPPFPAPAAVDATPTAAKAPSAPDTAQNAAAGEVLPEASSSGAAAKDSDAAFADHMEMVRFRLKTGYYDSKAINDALSEKLSGYFDELA